jgi:hypothetical protein
VGGYIIGNMGEQVFGKGHIPESHRFTPEQMAVIANARDGAIEWLSKRQFGGLNYTLKQRGLLSRTLEDVRSVLEAGRALDSRIDEESRYPYWVRLCGEGGGEVEIAVSKIDLRFRLLRSPGTRRPEERLLLAILGRGEESPFGDDDCLLLEFWRLEKPHEPFGDIDAWVKRLFETGSKSSILTKLLPLGLLEKRSVYPYQAWWSSDQFIDLVVTFDPGRESELVYVLRRFPHEKDGSFVLARRANFNKDNKPMPERDKVGVFEGKLALVPSRA